MNKLAYIAGVRRALQTLKLAAPMAPAVSMGAKTQISFNRGQQPTWGLQGKPPAGFRSQDPASIQTGAMPGGPSQLQGAPTATPVTRGGATPTSIAPAANPVPKATGAPGITPPIQSADVPAAKAPGGSGTNLSGKSDVGGIAKSTGGNPF